jgi:hypothetical protein
MAGKGQPYRTVMIGGFEVLVGRSADDKDRRTFDIGKRPTGGCALRKAHPAATSSFAIRTESKSRRKSLRPQRQQRRGFPRHAVRRVQ